MTEAKSYKDRSGVLIFFGVFLMLSGVLSFLLVLLLLFGSLAGHLAGNAPSPASMVTSILLYMILGAVFILLGVGSILKKRWAVTLIIALHWLWLGIGILSLVFMLMIFPAMRQAFFGAEMDPSLIPLLFAVMVLTGLLLLIIHPMIYISVYQNRHVRDTLSHYDPHPGRIEQCPIPVLVFCMLQLYSTMMLLSAGTYHWTVPFFGTFMSGPAGALMVLVTAMITLCLTWELFHLKLRAWRMMAAMILLYSLSFTMTFTRHDYTEILQRMDMSVDQMIMMQQMGGFFNQYLPVWVLISTLITLGYLLVIKRYFYQNEQDADKNSPGLSPGQ